VRHGTLQKLLSDQLKELWQAVELKQLTVEEFYSRQAHLLTEYRHTWERALLLGQGKDLRQSLVAELALFLGRPDVDETRMRCQAGAAAVGAEWREKVDPNDRQSIERFYEHSEAYLYDLMWWHTLSEDNSPLAYVQALHFARQHGRRRYLDFGSGVGSGGLLFGRHGFVVTLADISSTLLRFSQWRFATRNLPARFIDLKSCKLPSRAFDVVTAMDVFEHLCDPVAAVEELWQALTPGGFLIGRFHGESDECRPQHIVQDFGPTLQRMQALGSVEVWRDEWLWGQQVFQKT